MTLELANESSTNRPTKARQSDGPDAVFPEPQTDLDDESDSLANDGVTVGRLKFTQFGLFRSLKRVLFSSLTRRIVILNMTALAALLATILYVNQFKEGLIDSKIESLLTQGKIMASAIAGSATASPTAITIDPGKLLELKSGESLQPRLDPLDNLQYPISPEKIAPVLRALIKPTQTRARLYDPDGALILDSRLLYDAGRIQQFDLSPLNLSLIHI